MSLPCCILVGMTPKPAGPTPNSADRIVDNSRHERGETPSGGQLAGQIVAVAVPDIASLPEAMSVWMERYQTFAVEGARSRAVAAKIGSL